MCDGATAISFRHRKEMVDFDINGSHFKEYSKNWRQCIYIDSSNGNFVTSRQYPKDDENIAKEVRNLLEDKVHDYFNIESNWKINRERSVIIQHMRNYDIDTEDDWDDGEGSCALHYNDIWYEHSGAIIYNKTEQNLGETDIIVGCEPICPVCGKREITDHETAMCNDCNDNF